MAEAIKECTAARPLMVYLAQCAPQPERIPTTLLDGAIGNDMERYEARAALTVISLVEDDWFEDGTPAVSVHPVVQMVRSGRRVARRNTFGLQESGPDVGGDISERWR